MAKRRRPRFVQHIPDSAIPAMFTIVEEQKGVNYWHAVIRDAIEGDCPEFRYTPPKKGCPFTVQELANTVAGELNEGRGMLTLQEFINGIPTFHALFIANGRQVLCAGSSDETRIKMVDWKAAVQWLRERNSRNSQYLESSYADRTKGLTRV